MTILTQGPLAAAHLLFDIPEYSRDVVTVASGSGALKAGRVLGKVTASGKFVPLAPAASDGSQTAVVVLLDDVDATSADRAATVNARLTTVAAAALQWGSETTNQKNTALGQLLTVGIVNH